MAALIYHVSGLSSDSNGWHHSFFFKAANYLAVILFIHIWLPASVVFDEMMQIVTIKSGTYKWLPSKKIFYHDIQTVILKRYGHVDEEGRETNEGFFHLQLNNGTSYLMMVFKHKASIEKARKQLKKHSRLPFQS